MTCQEGLAEDVSVCNGLNIKRNTYKNNYLFLKIEGFKNVGRAFREDKNVIQKRGRYKNVFFRLRSSHPLPALMLIPGINPGEELKKSRRSGLPTLLRVFFCVRRRLKGAIKGTTGILSCDEFGDCGLSTTRILRLGDPASGA